MAPDTGGGNQSQYKKQISHTTKITAFSYRGINKRIKNVKHANHKPRSEIAIVFEASWWKGIFDIEYVQEVRYVESPAKSAHSQSHS